MDAHRFVRLGRTWVDCSSLAAMRSGILFYRPGRRWLRWGVRIGWWIVAAWLSLKRQRGKTIAEIMPGFDVEAAIGSVEFATIYVGNGSSRAKFTVMARRADGNEIIVKVAETDGGKAAICDEMCALRQLAKSNLSSQVPRLLGGGVQGRWGWSAQSRLRLGSSPLRLQKEHYDFLRGLKCINLSHGDFAPWNCAVVEGRLVVWDWEDAGDWVDGKDEAWFKKQVKELLGVDNGE